MKVADKEKFKRVIEKNTFYYFNLPFEEKYEGYLNSIKQTLLVFKNDIEVNGLRKEVLDKLLRESKNGLTSLLALTGFSNESLKRLITLIRVVDDPDLSKISLRAKWCLDRKLLNLKEWSDEMIEQMVQSNDYFRNGIVNLFFEGATLPFLVRTMPLFELQKLSISKLKFDVPSMIDTLVRYKEKGSYAGMKEKNAESSIIKILFDLSIPFETGDLNKCLKKSIKRTMDFIIPNKRAPLMIIESSFLATTSSGMGDKAKTEINFAKLIKRHYPQAKFIGFVDGIGWYVRKNDLKRMVSAYDDVFTFHKDELTRFEGILVKEFKNA